MCIILAALSKANAKYSEIHQSGKHQEKGLMNLAWEIKELTELNDNGRSLLVELRSLTNKLEDKNCDRTKENISRQLSTVRQKLRTFIKGVTYHKRTAATHVLVFMISPEGRNKKPYALPIQCIPYKGLSDAKVRCLANAVIEEMTKRNMKVAGMSITVN